MLGRCPIFIPSLTSAILIDYYFRCHCLYQIIGTSALNGLHCWSISPFLLEMRTRQGRWWRSLSEDTRVKSSMASTESDFGSMTYTTPDDRMQENLIEWMFYKNCFPIIAVLNSNVPPVPKFQCGHLTASKIMVKIEVSCNYHGQMHSSLYNI